MGPFAIVSPFSSPAEAIQALKEPHPLACRIASNPRELAVHLQIRRRIFVEEQRLFTGTDRDERDDDPSTVHVLGLHGPIPGGAVRLYPLEEPGRWKGDRLAVLPEFRKLWMGGQLVQFAVRTAGERGGRLMIAHIQPPNVEFFKHLGWHEIGEPVEFHGRAHQMMGIPLQRSGP